MRVSAYGEHLLNIKFPNNKTNNSITCNVFDTNEGFLRRLSMQACDILNDLRCSSLLCDGIIKVNDGTEFPVHRAILSASSGYFRALFTNGLNDTNNKVVYIGGIDSDMMNLLIEWAYTRNVVIDAHNVEKLLPVADQFQELGLVSKCIEFIEKNLNYENVIGIWKFSKAYYFVRLKQSSFSYLMSNFLNVVKYSQELVEISHEELAEILISDELKIKYEEDSFDVLIKWVEFDLENRKRHLGKLIKCLRLDLIPRLYLMEKLKNVSYLYDSDECKTVLYDRLRRFSYFDNEIKFFKLDDLKKRPRIPHEMLVVIGGWSSGFPTNSIEVFDCRADLWLNLNSLDKAPRAYHGCITLNNYIYVIGGFDGSHYFNNCRRFNILTKTWEEVAPMNTKRCYASVASHEGIIYAMGGFDGFTRQKTAEKYVPQTNQWSLIADMNANRSDASATELNGKIYICGGFNGQECLDSAEFYDPLTNVWTLIERMKSKRSGIGVISYNQFIYSIGGYDGEVRLNTCEKYDPITNKWTQIANMTSARSNFGIEVLDGSIFVMGGFNGITTIENVESYSDTEFEWTIRPRMNKNRSALSVCVLKGIEYVKTYSALYFYTNNQLN